MPEAEPLRLLLETREAEPVLTLGDVIAERRSVRSFAPRPVPREALDTALAAANAFDSEQFGGAPGDPWRPVPLLSFDEPLRSALRAGYAAAPELVLICGRVELPGLSPADGHRRALMRAAGFGYALWLAGRTAGLEGSVYGRSCRETTAEARIRLGEGFRHLFTVALGYRAAQARTPGADRP